MPDYFALQGSVPEFNTPLPVGQLYFPSRERYKRALRKIFDRQYYTNQGPIVRELENRLEKLLGVKNVICVNNATIGLTITAEALELFGKVILPAFTFIASAQSLMWAGLQPVFCDIDRVTLQMDMKHLHSLIDQNVSAIMGVNLWGGACSPHVLEKMAKDYKVHLYFDSAHAFGCAVNGKMIGNFGEAEVFSFHATKILCATEGGCVCSNDDDLAMRIRNIRSSYGSGALIKVIKTANGRMSEAQAAIALMSLDDFPENQKHNAELYMTYKELLSSIAGLDLVEPSGVSFSNYQYVVCIIDEGQFGISRDLLLRVLRAENILVRRYFYPGLHRTTPFADNIPDKLKRLTNTDKVCESCMQLPVGALVSVEDVGRICKIISAAHNNAPDLFVQFGEEH